jgi:hypothetical protein
MHIFRKLIISFLIENQIRNLILIEAFLFSNVLFLTELKRRYSDTIARSQRQSSTKKRFGMIDLCCYVAEESQKYTSQHSVRNDMIEKTFFFNLVINLNM